MSLSANRLRASTIVELLQERAEQQPSLPAYTFLTDGEKEEQTLTYGDLQREASIIAAALQSLARKGEHVLILYPPGLDYICAFFGCLYAGLVAVPAYPPRQNQSLSRLQAIVVDAQARVVLTNASVLDSMSRQRAQFDGLGDLRWLATDNLQRDAASDRRAPHLRGDELALLQYTSGSTNSPKGVMLNHRNLLHNSELIYQKFRHTSESRGVVWLPPYHDMGLIGGILQPLYGGFPVTLMSPYAFLQRPARWLQAISRTKATSSGGPNFAYELCVNRTTPEQLAALDLSHWDLAFTGAEPIRQETLERFAETFAPCGFRREAFYPCYGLAEATLFVSGGVKEELPLVAAFEREALEHHSVVRATTKRKETARTLVSCGRKGQDQKIAIADPETLERCPANRIGEIWLSGPSVAQGYWNRPEETATSFRAHLSDTGEGPFLRTGDMGFMLDDELFVTGRLKDLIITRGRNCYPEDIELTVAQSHHALRPGGGAAFSLDAGGEERLIVAHEVKRQYLRSLDAHEVISAVRRAVAEQHEISVHAVVLLKTNSIPKTSSGKIQRHVCRANFLDGTLAAVGSWVQKSPDVDGHAPGLKDEQREASRRPERPTREAIEQWLVENIAGHLKIEPSKIDPREPFNSYGLDSVVAANLSSKLEDWLGRRLSQNLLWEHPAIEPLARHLSGEENSDDAHSLELLPEYYSFELFPEYLKLKELQQAAEVLGGGNPYFKINDNVSGSTTTVNGRECINFSAYNYLGMSGDPTVSAAAKEAIDVYGTSVSASRIASGERPFHLELESELADLIGTEDAVVYIGGHTANMTTISTLCGPNDLILYDAYCHNSVLQGCRLSGARSLPFPHNDWQALDGLLRSRRAEYMRVLIVIEGVYSMDGDLPDLPRFIEVRKRHKALLMIDEAHSIGVLGEHGRGIGEYYGVNPSDVDLWMGTLSKSFASCGGYIAGSKAVIEYLKYTASGFVYSVGISPPNAAAALAAIRLLRAEPERVTRLHARANLFLSLARERGLINSVSKDSPVIPVIIGDSFQCIRVSQALLDRGINVQPIIYPAVEEKAARLRFFINSLHTEEQIRFTVETVGCELEKVKSLAQVSA